LTVHNLLIFLLINTILLLYLYSRAIFVWVDVYLENLKTIYPSMDLVYTYSIYIILCTFCITIAIILAFKFNVFKNFSLIKSFDMTWLKFNPINYVVIALFIIFIIEILITLYGFFLPFKGFFNMYNRTYPSVFMSTFWMLQVLGTHALCFWFILNYQRLSKSLVILMTINVGMLVFMEFFIAAGRRALIPIILFSFFYFKLYKNKFFVGIMFIIFLIFLFMTVIRDSIFLNYEIDYNIGKILLDTLSTNEFTAVSDGLFMGIDHALFYNNYFLGETYLNAFKQFVPRILWPEKPGSISHLVGVAISVYNEAFLNFWFWGSIIVGLFFYIINCFIISSEIVIYYLLAYSFDLGRSDIPAIFFYTLFHIIAYNCLNAKYVESDLVWKNKNA
jgi:hypothetical protein